MKRVFSIIVLLVISCNSSSEQLPVLSYTITESGAKEYYTITYEKNVFINQNGDEFTTKDLDQKIYLANFFFTRCPSICPSMRKVLIDISETFSDASDFMIVSHTIDPKHDTSEVLKQYSIATGISNEKWQFLTASEAQMKAIAKSYMTNFRPNDDGTDFYHSSYVALVDKNQQIRGFYNILQSVDVDRLLQDIKLLF